eukprot:gene9801-11609_t
MVPSTCCSINKLYMRFFAKDSESKYGTAAAVGNELKLQPYRNVPLGSLAYSLVCAASLLWMAIYIVVLVDYYHDCQFESIDSTCFYGDYFIFGDYDNNSWVFFTLWWLSMAWYSMLLINKDELRNMLRWPCDFEEAEVIRVWTEEEKEEVLSLN